jgi:hypothetical protein
VTKELLEQYYDIVAEIEKTERELKMSVATTVMASLPEFPYTLGTVSVSGTSEEYKALKRMRLGEKKEEKCQIEEFLHSLPRSNQRLIAEMKMRGESWNDIAAQMEISTGKRYSVNKVKKIYGGIF